MNQYLKREVYKYKVKPFTVPSYYTSGLWVVTCRVTDPSLGCF